MMRFKKNIIQYLFWLVAAWLVPAVTTAQTVRQLDNRSMNEIDSIVRAALLNNGLPGISIGIIYNGRVAYTNAYGQAMPGVQATNSTKYPIASVSKTITGILAMKMVENGDLRLDDLISDYVGGYRNTGITIRHLLSHQSGIGHYENCPGGYDGKFSWAGSLDVVRGCTRCVIPAGAATLYSTYGTTLLGVIIELVGIQKYGKTFTQLYNEWIRDVAGLTNLTAEHSSNIANLATGYDEDGDEESRDWNDIGWKLPAGGFVGTAFALAGFGAGVMNHAFIGVTTSDTMWRRQSTTGTAINFCAADLSGNYGLAFQVNGSGDNLRIHHNGLNDHGYSSLLYLYPNRKTGIVLLCNRYGKTGTLDDIRQALESRLLCPANRVFTSTINWPGNWIYEADKINGSNTLSAGPGTIVFDGAAEVLLTPGFHAQAGSVFHAIIDGCQGAVNPY